jgi:hypothetical protein
MDLSDSAQMVVLIWFTAVEAVFLLTALALFQTSPPGPRSSISTLEPPTDPLPPTFQPATGTIGPTSRVGFISRFGLLLGWAICFVLLLALSPTLHPLHHRFPHSHRSE